MAVPQIGESYSQEFYAGKAEDMAEVISLSESISVPYGSFDGLMATREWTPLEPEVEENKYYAPGIGVVKEQVVKGGSGRVELVSFTENNEANNSQDATPMKAVKLIIEHNSTDGDTGYQGFDLFVSGFPFVRTGKNSLEVPSLFERDLAPGRHCFLFGHVVLISLIRLSIPPAAQVFIRVL